MATESQLQKSLSRALEANQLCYQFNAKLTEWFTRFETFVDGPLYWPQLSQRNSLADSPDLGKLFPVAFCFSSLAVAQTLTMYWTAQIILFYHWHNIINNINELATQASEMEGLTCVCAEKLNNPSFSEEASVQVCPCHFTLVRLPRMGHIESVKAPAHKICQTAEYLLNDELGSVAAVSLIAPLLYVWIYMQASEEGFDREQIWIKETLCGLHEKGFQLPRHILTIMGFSLEQEGEESRL